LKTGGDSNGDQALHVGAVEEPAPAAVAQFRQFADARQTNDGAGREAEEMSSVAGTEKVKLHWCLHESAVAQRITHG